MYPETYARAYVLSTSKLRIYVEQNLVLGYPILHRGSLYQETRLIHLVIPAHRWSVLVDAASQIGCQMFAGDTRGLVQRGNVRRNATHRTRTARNVR